MENPKPKSGLRFDHREIAVVFSLFIFLSLLMFTVGIIVGKGVAQSKFQAQMDPALEEHYSPPASDSAEGLDAAQGAADSHEPPLASAPSPSVATTLRTTATGGKGPEEETETIELIPLKPNGPELAGTTLKDKPGLEEADSLLKNPKIAALVDGKSEKQRKKPSPTARGTASVGISGSTSGPYTVQVGSYPRPEDARARVNALKKLGFPHAYFSATKLKSGNETWYRVWLGYYPDEESAKRSGAALEKRGEVRNYLVRSTNQSH